MAEAFVAPMRPAAVAVRMVAMAVPPAPRHNMARAGRSAHSPFNTSGNPSGAVRINAMKSARHTTGMAPLRCCSGRAMLSAMPYEIERRHDQADAEGAAGAGHRRQRHHHRATKSHH